MGGAGMMGGMHHAHGCCEEYWFIAIVPVLSTHSTSIVAASSAALGRESSRSECVHGPTRDRAAQHEPGRVELEAPE